MIHTEAADALATVRPLAGTRFAILHPDPIEVEGRPEGVGDWDCVVAHLDQMWPLRLSGGWKVVQRIHHEVRGWCWVLERGGHFVALDLLDDPDGLGPLGFPSGIAFQGASPTAAVRAAYLVSKRLRKTSSDAESWQLIGRLARSDPTAFGTALEVVIGPRARHHVLSAALAGTPPPVATAALAERLARRWRFRDGRRIGVILIRTVGRVGIRLIRPTGMGVLIGGPDGTGKSTLARMLHDSTAGAFTNVHMTHWRPGILPPPGQFRGGRKGQTLTAPHSRPPHGALLSSVLLAYYWIDFLVGAWAMQWPRRVRNGLTIVERGWWDIAVDPLRYRLDVSPKLVRRLGTFLPAPQLCIILRADPKIVVARKEEISEEEVSRQMSSWPSQLPRRSTRVVLDVSAPIGVVADAARREVLDAMERQTASSIGTGWTSLPPGTDRWKVPRGPRRVASKALEVYQPVTVRATLGWHLARSLASTGAWRLLPRSSAPDSAIRELVSRHVPPRGTIAVARANHPGRFTVLLLEADGSCAGIAKVSTDAAGTEALRQEALSIRSLGPLLPPPVSPPSIIASDPGVLVLTAERWAARWRAWRLDPDVAYAMGTFGRSGPDLAGVPTHGDFTPWNLLHTATGWTLIDWEQARADGAPCSDLIHYLVMTHMLIGRPNARQLHHGIMRRNGWIGAGVNAYLEGAGLSSADLSSAYSLYLSEQERRPRQDSWARARVQSRLAELRRE